MLGKTSEFRVSKEMFPDGVNWFILLEKRIRLAYDISYVTLDTKEQWKKSYRILR